MSALSNVDHPVGNGSYARQRIPVEGWFYGDYRHDRVVRISAHAPCGEIGATRHLFVRRDVNESLRLSPEVRTGFQFLATFTDPYMSRDLVGIEIRAEFKDGTVLALAGIHIRITPNDFTGAPYGDFCNPHRTSLKRPEHGFVERKTPEVADPACVKLLEYYLPRGCTVLDVYCGRGAYFEPIRRSEHAWVGCEESIAELHALALRSRPHRAIKRGVFPWSRYRLPAADREFDTVIAMEVLDYRADLAVLLTEIKRVAKQRVIFSVRNFELLPYLTDRAVVPWAMLERNRQHLFTRYNLAPLLRSIFRHVELLEFGEQPLASPDGLPLRPYLLAVCDL